MVAVSSERPREDCFADLMDATVAARLARSASRSCGSLEEADEGGGAAKKGPRAWESGLAAKASEAASIGNNSTIHLRVRSGLRDTHDQ